ncbi:MAG: RlmE family RNA methyltransferase [Alphaproteobacteria bacterium]|jgi:23S rRNA (uridine2552-2'-O)-methyltransferase|nr:RlmE family RNA methyltransferase [Hyphomicrobiales bacterium]|tara:strand:+ start:17456 stop:18127 length:672 start_codon:yes stop_codon:yes gene_type:complete
MTNTPNLKVRVKTARGRTLSSTRWLQRHLNDPFVHEAKKKGYRSRAAFKIVEIDDKHKLFKVGQKVLDLGAAPGGWSQIAAERIGAIEGKGKVIAVDLLEMDPLPGVETLLLDFYDDDAESIIKSYLGDSLIDLVLCDMAASATGHKYTDHLKIIGLLEAALDFTEKVLKPDGAFLGKVFRGGTENTILTRMKKEFKSVKHIKPKSSRSDSTELYVLGNGFKG